MARRIVIANQKGGVGKTSITCNLAAIGAAMGYRTLVVDLDVQGNILDHEYEIKEGRRKIAQVSKKWFRVRDTYGVEVAPDQNDIVILAITVAVDMMAHN